MAGKFADEGVSVFINDKPTRKDLDEFWDDYREALKEGYTRVGRKVMGFAKAKAPVASGTLKQAMHLTAYKGGGFRIWFKASPKNKGVAVSTYAGPVHWGGRGGSAASNDNTGYEGTKFLYNTIYPRVKPGQPNPKKAGPVREWIVRDIEKAIAGAVDAINRKGAGYNWEGARW